MDYYSPLRYPGGKAKVAEYVKYLFKVNLLYDGIYVEPYAGGASVALSLLFNEYVSKIIINDLDRSVFSFWHSVLNKTDKLCQLIDETPVNVKTWDIQKKIQKQKENSDLLKLGFSTFFLNRTNRSGILKGGIIGGRDQTGKWKIGARYNKSELIKRIQRVALYKDKIELYNSDAVELMKKLRRVLPSKTLFYFDPPYYVKGQDLYMNHYKKDDHENIAKEIGKIKKQKWIVTYDNVPPVRDLYRNQKKIKYLLNYSAAKTTSKGEEVMIFSNNVSVDNKLISTVA